MRCQLTNTSSQLLSILRQRLLVRLVDSLRMPFKRTWMVLWVTPHGNGCSSFKDVPAFLSESVPGY